MYEFLENSSTKKLSAIGWENSKMVWKLFTIKHGNIFYFLNFIHVIHEINEKHLLIFLLYNPGVYRLKYKKALSLRYQSRVKETQGNKETSTIKQKASNLTSRSRLQGQYIPFSWILALCRALQ